MFHKCKSFICLSWDGMVPELEKNYVHHNLNCLDIFIFLPDSKHIDPSKAVSCFQILAYIALDTNT